MADTVALRYQDRDVVFEKHARLIAVRARAGMEAALEADIVAIAARMVTGRRMAGAFKLAKLLPPKSGSEQDRGWEQDLDWLRARPAVAAASHVFKIKGEAGLVVPSGHVRLIFGSTMLGHRQAAVMTRYRLQAVEKRGAGEYLARITSGSKNPIATAAALQAESGVILAEPELVDIG